MMKTQAYLPEFDIDIFKIIVYNYIGRNQIARTFPAKGVISMEYVYRTKGVCSQEIRFQIEGDVITDVSFLGGCNGNLKAIGKLVDGMTVSQIEEKLRGNTCGFRPTSCADQLALAVRAAYDAQH